MTKLVIKKSKALKMLNEKVCKGYTILNQIGNIKNNNDFNRMVDVHEVWWNSTGKLLKQIFDDTSLADNFLSVGFFVPQIKSLAQNIYDFADEVNDDISKIQQIISDIKNNIYLSTSKFEFTYDGIIVYLKKINLL